MSPSYHPSACSSHQGSAQPTYRILLVEDHDTIRQLCAKALVRAGYEVDATRDGQSVWEALA